MNGLGLVPLKSKSGKKNSSAKLVPLAAFLVLSNIVLLIRSGYLENSNSLDKPVAKNHLGEHNNNNNNSKNKTLYVVGGSNC